MRLPARYTLAFWLGVGLALLALSANALTTQAGGANVRNDNFNLMIHSMDEADYIFYSVVRVAGAIILLVWLWPDYLYLRVAVAHKAGWVPLVWPCAYQDVSSYFMSYLLIAIIPIRLVAALNNIYILRGGVGYHYPLAGLILGTVLGIFLANALFYWHFRLRPPVVGEVWQPSAQSKD